MIDVVATVREFLRVWPWLEKAIEEPAAHRKEHVWAAIERGDAQLWTNDGAAVVTEIAVYPSGLRSLNAWLSGGELDAVRELDARIDAYAREKNCRTRTIIGRRGWLRALPGYRETGVVLTKDMAA